MIFQLSPTGCQMVTRTEINLADAAERNHDGRASRLVNVFEINLRHVVQQKIAGLTPQRFTEIPCVDSRQTLVDSGVSGGCFLQERPKKMFCWYHEATTGEVSDRRNLDAQVNHKR